ncbi:MAG: SPOR domain-containing protein [Gallionellaceae bacterium]|jgi:DedD protein
MAKQLTADEEFILKRQARRRLIGAVALITAVVVILPMVFDSEPPASSISEIELRIPDKEKIGEFQAASEVNADQAPLEIVDASPVAISAVIVPAPEASGVPPVAAPAPQVSAPVAVVKPAAAPEDVHPVRDEKPRLIKKSPAAVSAPADPLSILEDRVGASRAAEAKQVEEKSKAKAGAKPVEAHHPKSGFVVQVGVFANADSAKKLQEKLHKQGLHVYSEKVANKIRIRIGGFATREAAEKVRRKLESQGTHASIVNLGS